MIEKTNSFDLIRECIQNGLDDSKIIDTLQEDYPTSRIESNINLITETRMIIESPPKPVPTETISNHFLVKSGKNFIDIDDGRFFKSYTEKPYSECRHGLCKKLGSQVLKNTVKNKNGYIPNVLVAITEKSKENKSVRIKYHNENKKQQVWEFDSQEIEECKKGIDEGLSDKKISIALFCPKECVQKLIKHIDINQKINGRENGNIKNKLGSRMDSRRTGRKR